MSRRTLEQYFNLILVVFLLNSIFFGFWTLTSTDHTVPPFSTLHRDQPGINNSVDAVSLIGALGDTEIQLHIVHSGSVELIEID